MRWTDQGVRQHMVPSEMQLISDKGCGFTGFLPASVDRFLRCIDKRVVRQE